MSKYITLSDITDSNFLQSAFTTLLAAKMELSDLEVEDVALSKGVYPVSLIVTPAHRMVKNYAVAWVCRELSRDLIGKGSINEAGENIYAKTYDVYKKITAEYYAQLSYEVFLKIDYFANQRPGPRTGRLQHGG